MKKNMGTVDRTIRFLAALVIIGLYATGQLTGNTTIVLGIVALLLLGTSLTGFCPIYPLLKISTIKKDQKAQQI